MDALTWAKEVMRADVPGLASLWGFIQALPRSLTPANVTFVAIGVVPMIFFYCYGALLFLVDTRASDAFVHRYKVQSSFRPTGAQYWDAFLVSVINWLAIGLPYTYALAHYVMAAETPPLPSVGILLRDLFAYIICEEILFYVTHRLAHHPLLYAPIHKFHHTYTAPFGIAAIYAHPIEHLFSNVIPVSAGPLLMGSHPVLPMIWSVLALFNTMTVHGGYDLSHLLVFPPPYFHDWHHEKFTENFGTSIFMDSLLGTSRGYCAAFTKGEVQVPRLKRKSA